MKIHKCALKRNIISIKNRLLNKISYVKCAPDTHFVKGTSDVWASSREKMILFHANITGTDRPALPRILISIIVILYDMLREKVQHSIFYLVYSSFLCRSHAPTTPSKKEFLFLMGPWVVL